MIKTNVPKKVAKMLDMEDDLDVIKMGAWMQSLNLFSGKNNLFYYWIFLSISGTLVQLLFFYFILKKVKSKNEEALSTADLTDEQYKAKLDLRYCESFGFEYVIMMILLSIVLMNSLY